MQAVWAHGSDGHSEGHLSWPPFVIKVPTHCSMSEPSFQAAPLCRAGLTMAGRAGFLQVPRKGTCRSCHKDSEFLVTIHEATLNSQRANVWESQKHLKKKRKLERLRTEHAGRRAGQCFDHHTFRGQVGKVAEQRGGCEHRWKKSHQVPAWMLGSW